MSQQIQFLIFFGIWCLIVGTGYAYVGWRLIHTASLQPPWSTAAWTALIILYILPISSFGLAINRLEHPVVDTLAWGAYTALAFMVFVISLLIVRDVGMLAWYGLTYVLSLFENVGTTPLSQDDALSVGRRAFLMQASDAGIVGAATIMTGIGIYEARKKPGIVRVDVPLPNLPEAFDGFRIVQLTDIHAGLTVSRPFVETAVREANALGADLIAFTGDLVDGTIEHLRYHVEPMKELSAPHGTFFITGNHEYYSGAQEWVQEVQRMGMDVLLNEHRLITRDGATIVLAGVTDHGAGNFIRDHASSPARALENAPAGSTKVLLAHQPKSIFEAAKAGCDLMISGHTHGGQFFPWNYMVALDQPYVSGLHKHNGTHIYVSKGTGYWGPPVRLGVRSEITVITLRKERLT